MCCSSSCNEGHSREAILIVAGQPIFSEAYYTTHNFEETTLDPPLGSGAYKVGAFRSGPLHLLRARRRIIGARICRSIAARTISTDPLRIFLRSQGRLRGLQGRRLHLSRRVHRRHLGDAYDFPAVQDGRVKRATLPRWRADRNARLVLQHPPRQVQGSANSRSDRARLRFRLDQQEHHVWRL